ncbi:MAG: hypothetical protein AAF657_31310 [Acidobacteriota bacterium]
MSSKHLSKLVIAVCIVAGLGFLTEGSPSNGPTIAGEYAWVRTNAAQNDPRQAICDASRPGDDCVELCMILNNTNSVPTGNFCCVDPGDIGGWDGPEECTLSVP